MEKPVPALADFNPRPLAGATPRQAGIHQFNPDFNPRPLAGATKDVAAIKEHREISIHAPLRGRLPGLVL